MKLYGYFRSSTSYRLRLALQLKGLEYENCPVNLVEGQQKGEAFAGRNPFATVPMLEVDGKDRVQSMAIIEWLDEAYPENPLLPADIEQRYLARELAYAIATELHAPLNLPVLKYLKSEYGQDQEGVNTWYRHWLAATISRKRRTHPGSKPPASHWMKCSGRTPTTRTTPPKERQSNETRHAQ